MKFLPIIFILLSACTKPTLKLDILIEQGSVLDGSGTEAIKVDIGIVGDSIVFVGNRARFQISAEKIIDATGYVVCPGFIDPHTHATADLNSPERHANLNYLYQGVTTVFIGSDGRSSTDIAGQFRKWEEQGIGTNAATYVGHATARRLVMGMRNEAPTEEELINMKTFVRNGMEAGAIGLGSGLYYAPANFAATEEVIELAKIAAEYDGSYDVHMRDESSYNIGLLGAVEETIRIGEEAGLHANIAHIKCLGVDVWDTSDQVIDLIKRARSRGVNITADQYPYTASGTSITGALIPRWVLADHPDPTAKLEDPKMRPLIIKEMKDNIRKRGGAQSLLLTNPSEKNEKYRGKTLTQVAEEMGVEPVEAAVSLFKNGGSSVGSFNMKESDIVNFMKQDWVMTSSDGSNGHPRKYGSFPKKMQEYVLEKQVLNLPEFVHKSSGMTATTFGISRRGYIKEGFYADIIIFKPERVKDHATFQEPEVLSEGMEYVIVNGKVVIEKGKYNGFLAGQGIRKIEKPISATR